jgi:hypothetical protein
MSIARLEFNLSDSEDLASYHRAVNSDKMAIALFEITNNLIRTVEHRAEHSDKDVIDLFAEELEKIINDCYINIDELIQ